MLFPFLFYNLFFSVLLVSLTSRDSQTRKEVNLISLNLPRKSLIRGCHFRSHPMNGIFTSVTNRCRDTVI